MLFLCFTLHRVVVSRSVRDLSISIQIVFRLHHICVAYRCGLLLQTLWHGLSVCVSVCLYVTGKNPAKTTEPIEMPFGMWAMVGPHNHDGGLDPQTPAGGCRADNVR